MKLPLQGYKDSNLEMTESESVALPFGDSPMSDDKGYYNRNPDRLQAQNNFFSRAAFQADIPGISSGIPLHRKPAG